jgi:hypothetical protein
MANGCRAAEGEKRRKQRTTPAVLPMGMDLKNGMIAPFRLKFDAGEELLFSVLLRSR